jgi:hypothetical protein
MQAILSLLLLSSPASLNSKWERLSSVEYLPYTTDDDGVKLSRHYYNCINGLISKTDNRQITYKNRLEHVLTYKGELFKKP